MKVVAGYHNKQYESDKSNIKVAGKKGPQKFSPSNWIIGHEYMLFTIKKL